MTEITSSEPEITEVNEPLLSPPHATVPLPSFYEVDSDGASPLVPMLLGLFAGRRGASLIVSQTVARQLEAYREVWGYSNPIVAIEMLWSLAFVVVSLATLFWFAREEKNAKLRVWIFGYVIQCVAYVPFLYVKYKERKSRLVPTDPNASIPGMTSGSSSSSCCSRSENDEDRFTFPISWDTLNTVVCSFWWVIGFIFMVSYNNSATPWLFWLTLAFLAMDVFCLVLRLLLICLLLASYCFFLPCVIAFMDCISRKELTTMTEVSTLPIYEVENVRQPGVRKCNMIPKETNGQGYSNGLALKPEFAECNICLRRYVDGEQLHLLPCYHHFHSTCIRKWLRIRPFCPQCKSLLSLIEWR